jgi:glucose-1-phosphate cytidylyltransferase
MVEFRAEADVACAFASVRPNYTSHVIESAEDGRVTGVAHVTEVGLRINGGFFVLHRRVFDYMQPGEEMMEEPFQRMIEAGDVATYRHDGFWACMDTFKEKRLLEDILRAGEAPWEVWRRAAPALPSGDGALGTPAL